MKTWIGTGLLLATLMVTGCSSNGYYGRNYRYDRYRYLNHHDRKYRENNRHRDHDRDRDRRDVRDNWHYR
jgi:hypothetical protein